MLSRPSAVFNRVLDRVRQMPVVDCHEHKFGPECQFEKPLREPILALSYYLMTDLVASGASDEEMALLQSEQATTDQKWPVFSRLWAATEYTSFAAVTKMVLKEVYGVDELSRAALDSVAEQMAKHERSYDLELMQSVGIRAVVTDVLRPLDKRLAYFAAPEMKEFLAGSIRMPEHWHPVLRIDYLHEVRRSEFINCVAAMSTRDVTSLSEYEEAVFELLRRSKDLGVVALKDVSAYRRPIAYDVPTQGDAEKAFNRLLADPRSQLAWPDSKPLDDHLFHQCMRFARELGLPVQIHTGGFGDPRNRVQNANAAHLASALELHRHVQFDLFHGNWPYLGDLLFLGKNYPNVRLNLCWVHMLDPLYSQELLKRAVMTVPHNKIHAFGGDFENHPGFTSAHLTIAREVIASALTDLIESGWLEEGDAIRIASDWLFNNPNQFYRLGLDECTI